MGAGYIEVFNEKGGMDWLHKETCPGCNGSGEVHFFEKSNEEKKTGRAVEDAIRKIERDHGLFRK
jgi:DnaJ-class molecular chaperone